MPAAMNLRPRKHAELAGMLRHDFRRYGPETLPAHIDPERQARNRTLWGEDSALDAWPTRCRTTRCGSQKNRT